MLAKAADTVGASDADGRTAGARGGPAKAETRRPQARQPGSYGTYCSAIAITTPLFTVSQYQAPVIPAVVADGEV